MTRIKETVIAHITELGCKWIELIFYSMKNSSNFGKNMAFIRIFYINYVRMDRKKCTIMLEVIFLYLINCVIGIQILWHIECSSMMRKKKLFLVEILFLTYKMVWIGELYSCRSFQI